MNKKNIILLSIVFLLLLGIGFIAYTVFRVESQSSVEEVINQYTVNEVESDITSEVRQQYNKEIPILTDKQQELLDIDFPIIAYGRPGLLNITDEGLIEKKQLEDKLINPFIDYYNEDGINLVSLHITVPKEVGDSYTVQAIFKTGGTIGFSFGSREQEYAYWQPECMSPCNLSDAYKEKYPEIANEVITDGLILYKNQEYGFSFYHPEDWMVNVQDGSINSKIIPGQKIKKYEWSKDGEIQLVILPEGEFESDRFLNSIAREVLFHGKDATILSEGTSNAYIVENYPITGVDFRIEILGGMTAQTMIANTFRYSY